MRFKIIKIAVAIMFVGLFGTVNMLSLTNSNANVSIYGYAPEANSPNPLENGACTASGNRCNLAITADANVLLNPVIENVYIIEIEFQEISSVYKGDSTTKYLHDVKGFILPKDFKLQITNCHDFPIVDGMIINISEKTLNDDGSLILNILKEK